MDNKSSKTFSRASFLKKAVLALGGISSVSTLDSIKNNKFSDSVNNVDNKLIRFITYNIYSCRGWSKYDSELVDKVRNFGQVPQRIALELALHEPDIITFSECPKEDVVAKIAELLNMNYVYFPGGYPGALLSKHEITSCKNKPFINSKVTDNLFTRHWGKAEVKLPFNNSIIVHSAHLMPFQTSKGRKIRLEEISEITKSVEKDITSNKSVILIGDLNHLPNSTEYKKLKKEGWLDTFAEVGKGEGKTIKSDNPSKRIDYILANGPIAKKVINSKPLFEGAFRTNTKDRDSFALSDHLPVMAEFIINGKS